MEELKVGPVPRCQCANREHVKYNEGSCFPFEQMFRIRKKYYCQECAEEYERDNQTTLTNTLQDDITIARWQKIIPEIVYCCASDEDFGSCHPAHLLFKHHELYYCADCYPGFDISEVTTLKDDLDNGLIISSVPGI